jgi:hypothetical protein
MWLPLQSAEHGYNLLVYPCLSMQVKVIAFHVSCCPTRGQ